MKVSIIIPIYNVEKYISECLESVIDQTLFEIEIICIDDGSTDSSADIVSRYLKTDRRITLIRNQNKGVAATRNEGILKSQGEYIAFMDPDDYYPSKDVLNMLYDKAKKSQSLICGGSMLILEDNRLVEDYSLTHRGYKFYAEENMTFTDYQYPFGYQRFIFSRKLLVENKIFFPLYIRFQDPPFFAKAMEAAKKIYVLPEYTYCYRKEHKNINWTPQKVIDHVKGLTDLLEFSSKYHLSKLHHEIVEGFKAKFIILEILKKNQHLYNQLVHASKFVDESLVNSNRTFLYLLKLKDTNLCLYRLKYSLCWPFKKISASFIFIQHYGFQRTMHKVLFKIKSILRGL